MNPSPFNLAPRPAPLGGFPASGFFYSNLRIQEALTTIRYGIEVRKGLVVLSGEAGIGKSTLLHKISAELGANILCIMASDPRLNFTDILRLILRSLDTQNGSEDEVDALRRCKFHLRARLQNGQIIALIFDNAQHLADSTLRQLTQNFLDIGPTGQGVPLLQIVLAGRPQLKDKLFHAARLPAQKQPILCELHPLGDVEIASYIEQALRSSDLPVQVFEPAALERIALYSRGNLRRINALCDRALQISDDGSSGAVTLELIEGVAKDLDFHVAELGGSRSSCESLGAAAEKYDPSQFQIGEIDTTAVVGETFLQYNRAYDRDRWLSSRGHGAGWVRALVVVVFVVGTGAWLRTDSARNLILGGREALSAILQTRQQSAAESTAVSAKPLPALGSAAMEPNRADAAATAENQEGDAPPTAQTDTNAEPPPSAAAETFAAGEADPPPKPAAKSTQAYHQAARHSGAPQRHENLQAQVMQAIENRAIIGVAVSVVQGTAFLDGQVATERQRRAAERAARSVTGVERVRNRIAINLG